MTASTIDHVSGQKTQSLIGTSFLVALAGLGVAAVGLIWGLISGEARPVFSWLLGLSFWLAPTIGMLFLIMIGYIFDAGWSTILRRQMEHWTMAFKYLAILFAPLLLISFFYFPDRGIVWSWMDPNSVLPRDMTVGQDILWIKKAAFLNPIAFGVASILFFASWIGFSAKLRSHSFDADHDGDVRHYRAARWWSAVGILTVAMTASFAAIYWFMSIEFHWFSTMYGVWFFAASMFSGLAVLVFLMKLQDQPGGQLYGIVNKSHYYFVGCIMLAFTVFWAYISFSQYFLIYSANIPEATFWYSMRLVGYGGLADNPWWWVAMGLIFGHFLIPFLSLLFYGNKVKTNRLLMIAGWFLLMHLLDIYWNVVPHKIPYAESYKIQGYATPWLITDLAMIVGTGALCFWAYLKSTGTQKAIPIRDPRISESIHYHE